jgi:hypothetical protein
MATDLTNHATALRSLGLLLRGREFEKQQRTTLVEGTGGILLRFRGSKMKNPAKISSRPDGPEFFSAVSRVRMAPWEA